jgi:hypothetical protein
MAARHELLGVAFLAAHTQEALLQSAALQMPRLAMDAAGLRISRFEGDLIGR